MLIFCTYCFLIIHLCSYYTQLKFKNMKNDVVIPKREKKISRLFVPVTPTEHKRIMQYCKEKEVKLTDLIRFALKETFEL